MGSSLPVVWLTEEHKHYDAMENLRKSARGNDSGSGNPSPGCFVCSLLRRSVSKEGRKAAKLARKWGKNSQPLCVKVWDERPLSLYTYAQLHVGKKAVGARLLLQRGTGYPFQKGTVRLVILECTHIEDVSVTAVYGGDTSVAAPLEGRLVMEGPLVPISKMQPAAPRHRQKIWLDIPARRPVWAWFMRDADEQDDGCDLFCLPLLELETAMHFDDDGGDADKPSWEVQGIVLSRKKGPEVFQRRSLFVVDGKHFNNEAREVLGDEDRVTIEIV